MRISYHFTYITLSSILIMSFLFALRFVDLNTTFPNIKYIPPVSEIHVVNDQKKSANTYAMFFFPHKYSYNTTYTLSNQIEYSQQNDIAPEIVLFSNKAQDKFTELADFTYVPPTNWFYAGIDVIERNKQLLDFTKEIRLIHKYYVKNLLLGENQFISTDQNLDDICQNIKIFFDETSCIKKQTPFDCVNEKDNINAILIQSEESIFNPYRPLTLHE